MSSKSARPTQVECLATCEFGRIRSSTLRAKTNAPETIYPGAMKNSSKQNCNTL